MANTSNFWSAAIGKINRDNRHPLAFFAILVLVTLPLGYAVNSISLGIFVAAALWHRKMLRLEFSWALLLPILFYLLMALSLVWTIDLDATNLALVKELPLLLIPMVFMFTPAFSMRDKRFVLKAFGVAMTVYAVYWLLAAVIRFVLSGDPNVFFYHELVTVDLNAIHVSVYAAVGFFGLFQIGEKAFWVRPAMGLLGFLILLLSSKNVTIVFVFLLAFSYFYNRQIKTRPWVWLAMVVVTASVLFAVPQVRERFALEARSMLRDNTVNREISVGENKVYNVSIKQAWSQDKFEPNHYFPGLAFRVYQTRIFFEMLKEDATFFSGYGLNASYGKIREKTEQDNLYQGNDGAFGYSRSNFHNQYVQAFAELGFFGFALLLAMLVLNIKKAFVFKDFAHISFAVLMISLFLTESFLWRQRGVIFFTMMYCLLVSGMAPARNNR